ncbi:MAG TPA: hypothetical protein VK034_28920 [Enhygromyxa sp.]|nr:hypothetical protein [Enhygromyxa sp.]
MFAIAALMLSLSQAPEPIDGPPRSNPPLPSWDSEQIGDPSSEPPPPPKPYDRKAPMNGGRLLGGGAVACSIGSLALAIEIR